MRTVDVMALQRMFVNRSRHHLYGDVMLEGYLKHKAQHFYLQFPNIGKILPE